jgi:hypothetical protein
MSRTRSERRAAGKAAAAGRVESERLGHPRAFIHEVLFSLLFLHTMATRTTKKNVCVDEVYHLEFCCK